MIGRTQHTDEVILAALRATLPKKRVTVDQNLVDRFTSSLMDAGVDLWALDELFEGADARRIEEAH